MKQILRTKGRFASKIIICFILASASLIALISSTPESVYAQTRSLSASVSGNTVTFTIVPVATGGLGVHVTNAATGAAVWDSGSLTDGTGSVVWGSAPAGSYNAVVIYLLTPISNIAPFTVSGGGSATTINILPPVNILPRVTPGGIIQSFIRLILIAAFVIAFIVLLIGGVRWIIAGGDKQALESARGMVTGAIVGLFLVLSVWAIIVLIETFFGVNIIRTGTFELPNAQSIP